MQFSIEVLPAPFGPMMARISPLRMSKETSVSAFTPPKPSETFSTASSTSPLVMTGPSGALIRRLCGNRGRGRKGGHPRAGEDPRTPRVERRARAVAPLPESPAVMDSRLGEDDSGVVALPGDHAA